LDINAHRRLKRVLDAEAAKRNDPAELSMQRPDPLLVASRYRDEYIALVCALFGYGNARAIVKFLNGLDFGLLDASDNEIAKHLQHAVYRFQKPEDAVALFKALARLKRENVSLEEVFVSGYAPMRDILAGLGTLIGTVREAYTHQSDGYDFLVGRKPRSFAKAGPYKRYMMFLRWMVRRDALDIGLWQGVDKADLVIPLDTHTAAVSRNLGLLRRKNNDFKAALELTKALKTFDKNDPVRYDFALYRIGQEKIALS